MTATLTRFYRSMSTVMTIGSLKHYYQSDLM